MLSNAGAERLADATKVIERNNPSIPHRNM